MLADLKDMKNILKDLFDSQPLAVLATQGDGQPYTNLVAFVFSQDLQSLFLPRINRLESSQTYRQNQWSPCWWIIVQTIPRIFAGPKP